VNRGKVAAGAGIVSAAATANPRGLGCDGCSIESTPSAKIQMLDSTSAMPISRLRKLSILPDPYW